MMEGVENIPDMALVEGLTWEWESFPQYLDALAARPRTIDVAVQVPHCAVRAYVRDDLGIANEPAGPDNTKAMTAVVREALQAGARGVTTTRTITHLTADRDRVPGAFAETSELFGLAEAVAAVGNRIIGWISDFDDENHELGLLYRMAERVGSRIWLTMVQRDKRPDQWMRVLDFLTGAADDGVPLYGQVAARPVGLMPGLDGLLHLFLTTPSYRTIANWPLAERVEILRDPVFRDHVLGERRDHRSQLMREMTDGFHKMFRLGGPPDYEPVPETAIRTEAERTEADPRGLVFDCLLERDGQDFILFFRLLQSTQSRRCPDHDAPSAYCSQAW